MNIQSSEKNDCTVRAIADAYSVPYETAHSICSRHGRQNGEGFHIQHEVLPKLGLILIDKAINKRVTEVLRFIVDLKRVYLCLVVGHIFAIRNGVPCETEIGTFQTWLGHFGSKKVIRLFEVPQK